MFCYVGLYKFGIIVIVIFPFIFVFGLGAIIGSFLNVVILRYNTGKTIGGRSKCLSCGEDLRAIDLIPIFSWIFLHGRCHKCGSKISVQYPLVEFATATIFTLLFWAGLPLINNLPLMTLYFIWNAIIFSILIVIFVYDLKHKIIPDGLSYTFSALSFIQVFIMNPIYFNYSTISLMNLLAGPILFVPFFALWFFSSGRWIGLGDGKLVLGIGWYLGFVKGISSVILAFWIGAFFAIALLLIERLKLGNKNITMKTEIPFAPFLIIGVLIEFFLEMDVIGIGLFF